MPEYVILGNEIAEVIGTNPETGNLILAFDKSDLHLEVTSEVTPIKNINEFVILRKKEDTSSINETPARELANNIISKIPKLDVLTGDEYYEVEDVITEVINGGI